VNHTEPRPDGEHTHVHDGPQDWDDHYAEHGDGLWSGMANEALIAIASDLAPGRALDVGCGEGADALWLAARGWQVTALDISTIAIERARLAAEGSTVDWLAADIADGPPATDYDLVSVMYPALPRSEDDARTRALLACVRSGGVLLGVWHAPIDLDTAHGHGFDPEAYVQMEDLIGALDDEWAVVVAESRRRSTPLGPEGQFTFDTVLVIRRC
jgi:SAM-dependent methyltransferase